MRSSIGAADFDRGRGRGSASRSALASALASARRGTAARSASRFACGAKNRSDLKQAKRVRRKRRAARMRIARIDLHRRARMPPALEP
ncbi:acetyl-CoA acetyltransferase [Burkholderia thailandensis]|nr:acetyl-CoA acetyltransferase [Burkholderia thailandensis]AWY58032.1 acetyl-CoA acetyltransferase [Burkholderia thailandensis]AWY67794.1 acetyl-CoA acetyltransferase [Burkholderia thailandensis]KVG13687.1 acetyl-CoA acetyltransferase [Burkholderia thailandensis]KVG22143.1 acetyl-CoA acetyltransferase [Burkholderia thailandensis]